MRRFRRRTRLSTTPAIKHEFERQIGGGYFQKADGSWWILSPRGWEQVNETSKALQHYISEDRSSRFYNRLAQPIW